MLVDHDDSLQCLPAMRCQLQPLDSEVLEQHLQPSVETHFIAALLDFSEWDDYNRDTYLWPQSIFNLLLDKAALQRFFHKAEHHVLRLTDRPLVDVFLFLLLAERLGCMECFDDYVDKYVLYGQCTLEVAQLFDIIKSIREDITSSTRRSCRVGVDYQADIQEEKEAYVQPSQQMHHNGKALLDFCTSPAEVVVATTQPHDSSPSNSSYQVAMDSYLGAVQLLRERYVLVDQLVEAPNIDIDIFRSRFTAYCEATGVSPLSNDDDDDLSPLVRYRRLKTMEEFIASSRRKGYALTALSTVKRIVVHASNGELLPSSSSAADMSQRLDFRDLNIAADSSNAVVVTGMVDQGEESSCYNEALALDDCRPIHPSNLLEGHRHAEGSSLVFETDLPTVSNMYEHRGAYDGGVGMSSGVNDRADSYAAFYDCMETREVDDRADEHGDFHYEGTHKDQSEGDVQFSQPTRPHLSIYSREVIEILDDDDNDNDNSSVVSPIVIDLTGSRSVTEEELHDDDDDDEEEELHDDEEELLHDDEEEEEFHDDDDEEEEEECAPLKDASNAPSIHTQHLPIEERDIPLHIQSPDGVSSLEHDQSNEGRTVLGGGDGGCSLQRDGVKVCATSYNYLGSQHHVKSLPADHASSAVSPLELLPGCLLTADHITHSLPHSYRSDTTTRGQEKEEALSLICVDRPVQSPTALPTHIPTRAHRRVVESVVIYRGVDELEVPIEFCRIFTVPDDLALDVFHSCGGQVDNALRVIEEKLRGGGAHAHDERGKGATTKKALMKEMRELHLTLIRPAELDILHRVVNK